MYKHKAKIRMTILMKANLEEMYTVGSESCRESACTPWKTYLAPKGGSSRHRAQQWGSPGQIPCFSSASFLYSFNKYLINTFHVMNTHHPRCWGHKTDKIPATQRSHFSRRDGQINNLEKLRSTQKKTKQGVGEGTVASERLNCKDLLGSIHLKERKSEPGR